MIKVQRYHFTVITTSNKLTILMIELSVVNWFLLRIITTVIITMYNVMSCGKDMILSGVLHIGITAAIKHLIMD
ncbi:hypothetical protein D3C80_2049980 [compost metagenome]